MIERDLEIGRWHVEFYFCPDGYDIDYILERMYGFGANAPKLKRALALMEGGELNRGFTFANRLDRVALTVVGPTSSGAEFIDTLTHEVLHLSVSIADSLGIDLRSETPAYVMGDSVRDLADVVCSLGCRQCAG
jgi:hypothetical protein